MAIKANSLIKLKLYSLLSEVFKTKTCDLYRPKNVPLDPQISSVNTDIYDATLVASWARFLRCY